MSPIRTYLQAGLDRARIARYRNQVSSDAARDRRATENVERVKLGGVSYI